MKFIDYLFYKIAKMFYRWDKEASSAHYYITLFVFFIIIDVISLFYWSFIPLEITNAIKNNYKPVVTIVFLVIGFGILFYFEKRYKNNIVIKKYIKDKNRKNFFLINILLFIIYFIPIVSFFLILNSSLCRS